MAGSVLTGFAYIPEGSEATPGLWNNIFSTLSQNITEANNVGGIVSNVSTVGVVTINANSNVTDYIHFHDTSNARSDYILGSFTTGTADGLDLYDASGQTMIVSFSKQSVRFYQNVVGPVFDLGGALTGTYNAATFGTGSQSTESRIQAAINQASVDGVDRVYLPTSFYPYSASSISFIYTVQMIREGGDAAAYDVQAYGADRKGVRDATSAFSAWLGASNAGIISSGTYLCGQITDTGSARREIIGTAGAVIATNAPTWLKIAPTAAKFGIRLKSLQFSVGTSATTATPIVWLEGANTGGVVDIEIDSLDFGALTGRSCDLLWLRACFNGRVANLYCTAGGGCRGILYGAKDFNSGNIEFDSITLADAGVAIQLGQAWNNANQNLLNQMTLTNFKCVRTAPTTGSAITVTLGGVMPQSATSLLVAAGDATKVAAAIAAGTPQWIVAADGVGSGDVISVTAASGTTLTLATPIPQALANGSILGVGTHGVIVMTNSRGVVMTNPHFESTGFGTYCTTAQQVTLTGARLNTDSATVAQVGVYCTQGTQDVVVQQPLYSKAATAATLLDISNLGTNARCQLIEPAGFSSGAGPKFFANAAALSGANRLRQVVSGYAKTSLTYGTTVTPDESWDVQRIVVTDGVAFSVAVPINRYDGAIFALVFLNTSGGAMGAVTFAGGYNLAGAFVAPATGTNRTYWFTDDGGGTGNIHEMARTSTDVTD